MFGSKGKAGKVSVFKNRTDDSAKSAPVKPASSEVKCGMKPGGTGANNKLPK